MMDPEEYVLGACMLEYGAIREAAAIVSPDDFYWAIRAGAFAAILRLASDGEPVEPSSVLSKSQEMGIRGLKIDDLFNWMSNTLSASTVQFYAEQVALEATRRRLLGIAVRIKDSVGNPGIPPSEIAQAASEGLKNLSGGSRHRMTTKTLEEILSIEEDHDWLIPGLLERGDRMIVTGYEGGGKTTWVRQLTICMAAGIHPTTLDRIDQPLTVLIVDAENTESQWRAATRGMVHNITRMSGINPAPRMHIHARGRIDITRNATLGEIHRLVDEHEPHVLAIGPIYKLVSTGINNDQEAAPVITALDSLRDRGLALIMEGHSAKGNQLTQQRDLAPRGSAALMGWPEFGFGINLPDPEGDPNAHRIQRWRGDREVGRQWPKELLRGGLLPWTGNTVSRGVQAILSQDRQDHHARYN
jgi:replicative DNA helicase